jgi:hypothetical protein
VQKSGFLKNLRSKQRFRFTFGAQDVAFEIRRVHRKVEDLDSSYLTVKFGFFDSGRRDPFGC